MWVWHESTWPPEHVLAPYRKRPIPITVVGAEQYFTPAGEGPRRPLRALPTLIVCGGMGSDSLVYERFVPGVAGSGVLVVWFHQAVRPVPVRLLRCASWSLPARPAGRVRVLTYCARCLRAAPRQRHAPGQHLQHGGLHGRRGAGGRRQVPAQLGHQQHRRCARLLPGRPGGAGRGVGGGAGHPGRGGWAGGWLREASCATR
jgi:hypothetical protein